MSLWAAVMSKLISVVSERKPFFNADILLSMFCGRKRQREFDEVPSTKLPKRFEEEDFIAFERDTDMT